MVSLQLGVEYTIFIKVLKDNLGLLISRLINHLNDNYNAEENIFHTEEIHYSLSEQLALIFS